MKRLTYSEYCVQKGLGTLNYFDVARTTKSNKILFDIVKICQNTRIFMAVVTNIHTSLKILKWIVFESKANHDVIVACCLHPKITLDILTDWMCIPSLEDDEAVRLKYRQLQILDGEDECNLISIISMRRMNEMIVNDMQEYHLGGITGSSTTWPVDTEKDEDDEDL